MEIQTILSTFLGSTQEAPMGDFWVIPPVTSLTERSVCTMYVGTLAKCGHDQTSRPPTLCAYLNRVINNEMFNGNTNKLGHPVYRVYFV